MKKSYFTTKEEAEKHKTEKQRVYYDTTKKMFYLREFKTGNASSGRFDRFNTLKTQEKYNYAGGSPSGDIYFEEEDVCNAVVEFRCKLKEYGNDYLISYYDKVFGRFD